MLCEKCGKSVPANETTCPHCGAGMAAQPAKKGCYIERSAVNRLNTVMLISMVLYIVSLPLFVAGLPTNSFAGFLPCVVVFVAALLLELMAKNQMKATGVLSGDMYDLFDWDRELAKRLQNLKPFKWIMLVLAAVIFILHIAYVDTYLDTLFQYRPY